MNRLSRLCETLVGSGDLAEGARPPAEPSQCAAKRVAVLEGTLEAMQVQVDMLAATVTEMEMEISCKDEQVSMLKAVVSESGDQLQARLATVHEEALQLRAQLARQRAAAAGQKAAVQQAAALRAALAQANARLKAAGARPVAVPGGGPDADVGAHDQRPARLSPSKLAAGRRSLEASEEGPSTPLSPGPPAAPASQKASSGSWDASDGPAPLALCCSPIAGGGRQGDEYDDICSPRSDLSGPSCSGEDLEGHPLDAGSVACVPRPCCASPTLLGGRAAAVRLRANAAAAMSARLARDNPLFRSSVESRRVAVRGAGGVSVSIDAGGLGALSASLASLDEAPMLSSAGAGGTAAVAFLARTQLELQLHQAQRRLAALQASAALAGNNAAGAQARLRASVRCLERLHSLLASALEMAAGDKGTDLRELRAQLAAAVQDLARMARASREMGSCLDALRLMLQRMNSSAEEEEDQEEALGGEGGEADAAGAPAAGSAAVALH